MDVQAAFLQLYAESAILDTILWGIYAMLALHMQLFVILVWEHLIANLDILIRLVNAENAIQDALSVPQQQSAALVGMAGI